MPKEEINHEKNLNVLSQVYSAEQLYREYRKNLAKGEDAEEGDLVKPLRTLEAIITEQNPVVRDSFMTASTQAIDSAVAGYKESKGRDVQNSIKQSSDYLVDKYLSSFLDPIIQEVFAQASSSEDIKKLPEDQRRNVINVNIYEALARSLAAAGFKPNSEEAEELERKLKALEDSSEDEKKAEIDDYLQEKGLGFMRHAVNYQTAFERLKSQNGAIYRRTLAKGLLTETKEGYSVDKDKFKELYGNEDNYKKMASQLLTKKAQEQKREAA